MITQIDYIGEVVESSTRRVVAQIPHIPMISPPTFGSFVKIDQQRQVYGVVYNMITTSVDPNRQPVAYGIPVEELAEQMPHIFELQRTNFEIAIVGFYDQRVRHHIPPLPPRIHSRVYSCLPDEILKITEDAAFLRMILANPNVPTDELIATTLRITAEIHPEKNFLITMGKELSHLLTDDYGRLRAILQQLQ